MENNENGPLNLYKKTITIKAKIKKNKAKKK
jgi:hypothetical protein